MRMMEIRLRVSEDRVTTLYDVVRGYCECVSITPVEEKSRKRHFVNGVKNKGIRGDHLILAELTSGPKTMAQLRQTFRERGFAESSCDSALNKVRHLIRHTSASASGESGYYTLTHQQPLSLVSP